jgi:hypothetical protein
MLTSMAAKNKPKARGIASQQPGTLLRASDVREHLIEEARKLRAEGKISQARGVEKRAEQVDQLMGALEADYRSSPARSLTH